MTGPRVDHLVGDLVKRKGTAVVAQALALSIVGVLFLYIPAAGGNQNVARDTLRAKSFINQDSNLGGLVQAWKDNEISVDNAKQKLWEIVGSPEYVNHRPSRGIVFVKTHKTGSSTVASVLHSLATSHGMIAPVMESGGQTANVWKPRRRPEILDLKTTNPSIKGAPYDIWTNHVIFDNLLLEKVIPSASGKVVSIVRDPATRVRSACGFYKFCDCPSNKEKWDKFVLSDNGKEFFSRTQRELCGIDNSSYEIVGTGLHPGKPFEKNFEEVIVRAKSGEFLLMVMERIVESMLVFWHEYELHPLDVAFLSKKQREEDGVKANETLAAESAVRTWSQYDSKLHSVADELLTNKLEEIFSESSMKQAQEDLEALNDMLYHVCQKSDVVAELSYWCLEKMLDNVGWNTKHSAMLEETAEQ